MTVSTAQIKELREATGAGILDCRKALEETGGDLEKAIEVIRERGLAQAAKRAGKETSAGVLDLYSHGEGRVGVMVEVNCETDFVARTEAFRTFAHEVALQIAATDPKWLDVDEVPAEAVAAERAQAQKMAADGNKPDHVVDQIVQGRLEKFYDEHCLLRQVYIRDDAKTVATLLQETIALTKENIAIRRFVRWTVGEELA